MYYSEQFTHTRLTALCPGLPRWAGTRNLDFTAARDSERQWYQLCLMQVGTSLQTDNHASTSLFKFFTGRMPFLPPNQHVKALKAILSSLCKINIFLKIFKCLTFTVVRKFISSRILSCTWDVSKPLPRFNQESLRNVLSICFSSQHTAYALDWEWGCSFWWHCSAIS